MAAVTIVGRGALELQAMLSTTQNVTVQALEGEPVAMAALSPVPEVLVVDARGVVGVPDWIAPLTRRVPTLGVVLVTTSLEPDLLLAAMRAGVAEVVPSPVDATVLARAVASLQHQTPSNGVLPVTVFIGAKGGVGTTTAAVNVSTALGARRNGRVLVLDMHPIGGDVALAFGVDPTRSLRDAVQSVGRLDGALLKGLVVESATGVDVLAGPGWAEAVPLDHATIERLLAAATDAHYTHAVIDLSRHALGAFRSLRTSLSWVLLLTQELPAVRNGAALASALCERAESMRLAAVVNRYDTRAELSTDDIADAVGVPIVQSVRSDYAAAVRALHAGTPLALSSRSGLGKAWHALAHELTQTNQASQGTV